MLKGFLCPDGQKIDCTKCLESHGCRMANRCHSLSLLNFASSDRVWIGKPSCTQLINGTRMEWLKLKNDYYINPDDRMFAILGTKAHIGLQNESEDRFIVKEQEMEFLGITGTLDELDIEGTQITLIDHKTSGSYKVGKALEGDMDDWVKQLNFYRMAYESMQGVQIRKMYIEAIVRDGGTWIATKRGITKNSYMIEVPFLSDNYVAEYFVMKRDNLLRSLEMDTMPMKCTDCETWDGNRCKSYCDVSHLCK